MQSKLTCFWKDSSAIKKYRTCVSLHSHTSHSKEKLTFISKFAGRSPLLHWALTTYAKRAYTRGEITVDFAKAYWTPPLSPLSAFRLERDQIEQKLELNAMVSLTDHDNIEAPRQLRILREAADVPVSVEWTAPYGEAVLHVGVHNIDAAQAERIMADLAEYTANPEKGHLRDLFEMLDEDPGVLIVLNHPMWDLAGIGKARHLGGLHDFLGDVGDFVHAFELSGVRSWEENRSVLELAEKWNRVVISGGDRHGAEPNAILNLTNARTFAEFVNEVRQDRMSHVLFMPQYSHALTLRMFEFLVDTIREYPDRPEGSRIWDERVFHPDSRGVVRSLADMWTKPPSFVTAFFALVRVLDVPFVQNALRTAFARPESEMGFSNEDGEEASVTWARSRVLRSSPTRTTRLTAWPTPAANLKPSRENENSPS